jgi:regulator of sigma E protease
MFRHEYPAYFDQPATLGWVMDDSAAQKAGFQAGDKITVIQGKSNPTWDDVRYQIFGNINQSLVMDVARGAQTVHLEMPVRLPEKEDVDILQELGLVPEGPSVVGRVEAGAPAEKAGIQTGDEIVAVNDIKVQSGNATGLAAVLEKTKDQPIRLTVLRKGQTKVFDVTPQLMASSYPGKKSYRIGVEVPQDFHIDKLSLGAAFSAATIECKKDSSLIFKLLGQLFTVRGTLKQFSGPVGIMQESGRAAQAGFSVLLQFMALISLNLAIFNMLPIPILDGGLVLMLLVEAVMRRDIKQEVKERVYQVAFVFLILFAAVVIFNDVTKTLHK